MSCIAFWKDKKNLNPITMKYHPMWKPREEETEETKTIKNERKQKKSREQ